MSATALRWMIVGEWRAHPGRIAIGTLAIAIGVALGFAVHLVNASALTAFDNAINTVTGAADLRVEAVGPAGIDESLYPRLARTPGIAGASPVVELRTTIGPARGQATLLGVDVLRAAAVTPSLIGRLADGSEPDTVFAGDAMFLSGAALAAAGARIGDLVAVSGIGSTARFRIVGTLPGVAADQAIAVADIAAVQWRFGRLGRIDRVDLKLAGDAAERSVRASLDRLIGTTAIIADRDSDAGSSDSLSRAYRVNLDMLALVALLTGAFLVYSAQSLSVTRRATQFALLRVLGADRRLVVRQLLIEGVALGLLGSAAGLLLGLGLAQGALRFLGGDLGGGYFSNDGGAPLVFAPAAAALFLTLGVAAAVIGSVAPALASARVLPAVALKNTGNSVDPRVRAPILPALLLLVAAGFAALLPPVGDLPLFGYLSIGLLLAGGVAAMPWLARFLLSPLAARSFVTVPFELAVRRLWGAPGQATLALSGIVASTSLMIAMAVMVASFRGSVDEWLGDILADDLYLRVEGGAGLDPQAQRRLAMVRGVAAIAFSRQIPLRLDPRRPPVTLIARADPGSTLPAIGGARLPPRGTVAVWLSEPAARLYDRHVGEAMALPIAAPAGTRWFVAGIWRDYARQHGAIAIDTRDYARLTGDAMRDEAAITLDAGASASVVMARLRGALPPPVRQGVTLAQPRQLRTTALALFDRSFAVTYLLEGIAIVVGLAGVAATFSAQTIDRAREFGMLRHIGVTRAQILLMLGIEGALLGTVGVAAGIALGTGMSQVLIQVVNPQSFHWTMQTRLPTGLFAGVAGALIMAAAGTAMLAGRRAVSLDAVRATREDM